MVKNLTVQATHFFSISLSIKHNVKLQYSKGQWGQNFSNNLKIFDHKATNRGHCCQDLGNQSEDTDRHFIPQLLKGETEIKLPSQI